MKKLNVTNSWSKIRFDKICKNISERIDDPKQAGTDYYVGLEHLDSEEPEIRKHGTPDDVNATKLRFKAGQILFGKRRFYQRKLAIANREGICSAHMLVLEAIEGNITKDFLPLLMQTEEFYERAMMISEGSLSPTIKWKNLAKQEFWIPSILEQGKIVKIIQNIDATISRTQVLLDKFKIFKNSKANELLTKGIKHTKFKKVKSFFNKYEEIPDTWEILPVSSLTKSHKQGFYTKQSYSNKGIKLIRITDLQNPTLSYESMPLLELDDKTINDFQVNLGDFLIARSGAIGRFGIVNHNIPCVFGSYIIRFVFDHNKLLNEYFGYCYQANYLVKQLQLIQQRSSNTNINAENIKSIKTILPPIDEQLRIVSILSKIDDNIEIIVKHLSYLKLMRKSILNEKLTMKKLEGASLVQ